MDNSNDDPLARLLSTAGARAPGHWVAAVDPGWDGTGPPARQAVVGGWVLDPEGRPGAFQRNPAHQPSPRLLGMPPATDTLDACMQLVAAGYARADWLARIVLDAVLALPLDGRGQPAVTVAPDGRLAVPAYTAPQHLPETGLAGLTFATGRELADRLDGDVGVLLDPGAAVSVRLERTALTD